MKHIRVDGKLLNTDKKFSHLKQKQKEKISEWFYSATLDFYRNNGKMPNKNHRMKIIDDVYEKIQLADIWIPYSEIKNYYIFHLAKFEKRVLKEIQKNSDDKN